MRKVQQKEEGWGSAFRTDHESSGLIRWDVMLNTEENRVLFTPGSRIKASEEQRQGKGILFKAGRN